MRPLNLIAGILGIATTFVLASLNATQSAQVELIRIEHEIKKIEGWKVHVDKNLLEGEHAETGKQALHILAMRLQEISLKLPEGPVAEMRKVPIFIDHNHPIGNNHYHPGKDWLVERGYDPALTRAVQITNARTLIREAKNPNHGSVMLHELAHAYHDQVLGFDQPEILAAYQQFCDSRKFDRTASTYGRQKPHYGLTDHKEYFAEMTETFFTGNNYYPFTHYQLYHEHRPSYKLMQNIWGTDFQEPKIDDFYTPSILDLRIMANLKSQRGEFDEALAMIEQALERSDDSEGRLANLKKLVEERRDAAEE
ncbi:MAG: hypothetical protein ACPGSB_01630 [Opitutales bacterium]